MDNRVFNVYYILDGKSIASYNHYLGQAMVIARQILFIGGEITGIIDAAEDE